jgi:hypothetical protein
MLIREIKQLWLYNNNDYDECDKHGLNDIGNIDKTMLILLAL